jgi:hypothetical protein
MGRSLPDLARVTHPRPDLYVVGVGRAAAITSLLLALNGVYPGLRPVSDIDTTQIDSIAGVYPALTSTARLAIPDPDSLRLATAWAKSRKSTVAFAVATLDGRVTGLDVNRRFRAASLTKAMLLIAFLRRADAENRPPTAGEILSLTYMIRVSDNASAQTIYHRTGNGAMRLLALDAGMRRFSIAKHLGDAWVTAADQARFFAHLGELVPRRYSRLAFSLLEGIAPIHSWGIPAAARPQWRVFFKGGWRPDDNGSLVHQGALLESGTRRFGLAVMTDDNDGEDYGHKTIRGITARLIGGPAANTIPVRAIVPRGRLVPLDEFG